MERLNTSSRWPSVIGIKEKTAMSDPNLSIRNVSHSYAKGQKAVSSLSLDVAKGEVYGFLGPNGAGKSTTIKLLSGIMELQEGEIFLGGISLKENPVEAKRILGYVPDESVFYQNMKGIDHLNFIADVFGVGEDERRNIIERYAELFELTGALGKRISSYSHGMKQKLSLIAALLHKPEILVLDEPLVGLDPKGARIVKDIMHEIASEGRSVFFSTHVLEVAEDVCDKVGIIDHGHLIAEGSPDELRGQSSLEDFFLSITEK